MEFLITDITIEDRHTEPRSWLVLKESIEPIKHEEVTLTLTLKGSGDTREFTNLMLLKEIMKRLEVISTKK